MNRYGTKSKIKARTSMMKSHPEMDWDRLIVHHIDGNPFNNNDSNLCIISRHLHYKIHQFCGGVKPRKHPKRHDWLSILKWLEE